MMTQNPVAEGVDALKDLQIAYRRLFKKPSQEKAEVCERQHRQAVEALEQVAKSRLVDVLIEETRNSNQADVKPALLNLVRASEFILEEERRLGGTLGFTGKQVDGFIRDAEQGLRAARRGKAKVTETRECASLVTELDAIQKIAFEAIDSTRKQPDSGQKVPRVVKRVCRNRARKQVRRRLAFVGSIVANGRSNHVFPYSYAIGLGLSAERR